VNWFDYGVLVVIGISALISLTRGFVREALALAAWVVSIWVAVSFSKPLAVMLEPFISTPSIRMVAAFLLLFAGTLLAVSVINMLAVKVVKSSGLTGTDRAIGMVFGIVRGVFIVAVLVFLAGLTPLPQDAWWSESLFMPHFQELALWLRDFLPADAAQYFSYPGTAE